MLINLFGNILVYFVVLKFRDMRIPMNHLLVNLAISDMMVGFLCAIFGQPFSTSNTTRTLEAVCHFGQRQTSLNTTASLTAKYSSLYLPWLWGFSILFSFINSGLKEKLRPRLWLNEQYSSTDVASPRWWSQWIWSTAFAGFQTVFFYVYVAYSTKQLFGAIHRASVLMVSLNSAVNPVIYSLQSHRFRRHLAALIKRYRFSQGIYHDHGGESNTILWKASVM